MKTLLAINTVQIVITIVLILACLAACQKPSHDLAVALIIFGGTGAACAGAWCFRQLFK